MSRRALFVVPVVAGLLCALGGPAAATEKNLLVGTWSVEASKLAMPNPPRSVSITLADAGGGKYRMSVDIVDHEGKASHGEGIFKPDGTASPATGSLDVDVVSMTMPSRRILVMGAGIAGHPSTTRVFSLADDGKHMIETVVGHKPDGTPTTRVDIWNRQ
jgi:hypothetical protein